MNKLIVRRAAVLGAGVMGAQIAAHLANAGVPVVLFDLPGTEDDRNGVVRKALDNLTRIDPAPLAHAGTLKLIDPANYDDHLPLLGACDLVIEAIAEHMALKAGLFERIAPHLAPQAVVATNTSGLSIAALAEGLPASLRRRFCGIHFFNPPRYMRLVEVIGLAQTDADILDALETWLTSRLGKGVIRAPDTPNFVANRIGVFAILAVMRHTAAFGLGFDEVDALTGPRIGRPKSATYRTADVVGLDTLAHVVRTMHDALPDDPWHDCFVLPTWLQALIDRGALGQKTHCGVFRKRGGEILVFDPATQAYRPSAGAVAAEVDSILGMRDPAERFAALRASSHPQAQFLWAIIRDVLHYCAVQLECTADNARDVDLAMRWGFGWALGPFETWQAAGWNGIAAVIAADIAAGKGLSRTPLPAWALEAGRAGVHSPAGSYSALARADVPRSSLPVYARQLFPDRLLGEAGEPPARSGETLYENGSVRLWRLPLVDAGIGILSFSSKMHTIGDEVLEGIMAAIGQAESRLDGMAIWHEPPFSAGADLAQLSAAIAAGRLHAIERSVEKFQRASQALRYAQVPVVAAVQGLALGGGCELAMHAAKRVMALETYAGLVEAGVGLIPAGGGCKEFVVRAARWAGRSATPGEVFGFLLPAFQTIALAKVAKSAFEAVDLGFARHSDAIVFNTDELLFVALRETRALADAGWTPPPMARDIPVAGRSGIATFEMTLLNMREGGMISAHDYRVAKAAAVALCGGDVETGSRVDEEWLLGLERRLFLDLLRTPETQARIRHRLETGKPLRN